MTVNTRTSKSPTLRKLHLPPAALQSCRTFRLFFVSSFFFHPVKVDINQHSGNLSSHLTTISCASTPNNTHVTRVQLWSELHADISGGVVFSSPEMRHFPGVCRKRPISKTYTFPLLLFGREMVKVCCRWWCWWQVWPFTRCVCVSVCFMFMRRGIG